ncbi:MAG TPA: hypothetical protein VLX60_14825 [Terriglobales bacterium]|nr:hypothetical protein [Terriglobales bacterium]
MQYEIAPPRVVYRNFNLCPHCEQLGEDPLLLRMSESMPMISRSDGKDFHLVLADRPLPYPAERLRGPADKISLCFWYSFGSLKISTKSSLVLAPAEPGKNGDDYRSFEFIADLLTEKLLEERSLAVWYSLEGKILRELCY